MFRVYVTGGGGGGTAPVISATPLLTDNAIDVTGDLPMTFHYTNTASATPPSAATIKAAPDSRSLVSGANSLTGLTQETDPGTWYFHYLVSNAAGDSAVETESYVISAVFDPADLTGAEVVVDVSDITTLWQDTAGTTQVTTSGQTVGAVTNRGTLGGLFVNTGGSDEPTYTEAAGRKQLDFDGTADYLRLDRGGGAAFGVAGGFYLWILAYDDGSAFSSPNRAFAAWTAPSTNSFNQANGLSLFGTGFGVVGPAVEVRAGLDNANGIASAELQDNRTTDMPWAILEIEAVPTAASPNVWLRVEKTGDGAPVSVDTHSTTSWPDDATNVKLISLGAAMNGGSGAISAHHKCSIAAVVLVSGTLTTGERDDVRAWLRTRAAF
jgi:hypothetical protein